MNGQHELQPFAPDPAVADLRLTASLRRDGDSLRLQHRLQGPLDTVVLEAPAPEPERRDGLWQSTCLECFLTAPGEEAYWEINLSPAGHWNLYRLSGYRRDLSPEPAFTRLPFQVRRGPGVLELDLACSLPPGLAGAPVITASLCAVIAHRGGSTSYWALAHPATEPDFHHRGGFQLSL